MLLTSKMSHHEPFGFPVRLCVRAGLKCMCADRSNQRPRRSMFSITSELRLRSQNKARSEL